MRFLPSPCLVRLFGLAAFLGAQTPALTQTYNPPSNSQKELSWIINRPVATKFESYRAKFRECDLRNTFGGKPTGKRGCFVDENGNGQFDKGENNDHNNVRYLFEIAGSNRAILFESKLSLDLDGGYLPCILKLAGTNQCATSFRYDDLLSAQYEKDKKQFGNDPAIPDDRRKKYFEELFVKSDLVPYVVAPHNDTGEFSMLTGVKTGDVGVVVYNNIVVPVFVADRGPFFRLGEASVIVFELIKESRCAQWTSNSPKYCQKARNFSISRGVTTILFPASAFAKGVLTPDNTNEMVRKRALALYENLRKGP